MPKLSIQELGSGRHSHNWMMGSFVRKRLNHVKPIFGAGIKPWFPVDFPWFRSPGQVEAVPATPASWTGETLSVVLPCAFEGVYASRTVESVRVLGGLGDGVGIFCCETIDQNYRGIGLVISQFLFFFLSSIFVC